MFISSPSHGLAHGLLGHFLFVCPPVFVSRHVSRSVDYVLSSRLALPAAGGVEALLVRPRKLGGVREAAHCRGSHCSLGWHLGFWKTTFQFDPAVTGGIRPVIFLSLTVTPEMMGDFPSTSLKISASASSPLFSLYFFLASSASAVLNSSYVMLRQDFFLKKWVQRERLITQHKHWQLSLTCLAALSAGLHRGLSARLKSSECRRSHVIASTGEKQHAAGRRHPAG